MATLSGNKQNLTFQLLVKLGQAVDGTLRALQNGFGTDLPVQVSTAGVNFTGTATRAGKSLVDIDQLAGVATAALFTALAYSEAEAQTLPTIGASGTIAPITVGAGAGVYTAKVVLPVAGAISGNRIEFPISLPAGAGRTVEFRNATSSGTVLESFVSLDLAARAYFYAYFDGAAWQPLDSNFRTP